MTAGWHEGSPVPPPARSQHLRRSGLALSCQILQAFKREMHQPSGDLSQIVPPSCRTFPDAPPKPVQCC